MRVRRQGDGEGDERSDGGGSLDYFRGMEVGWWRARGSIGLVRGTRSDWLCWSSIELGVRLVEEDFGTIFSLSELVWGHS